MFSIIWRKKKFKLFCYHLIGKMAGIKRRIHVLLIYLTISHNINYTFGDGIQHMTDTGLGNAAAVGMGTMGVSPAPAVGLPALPKDPNSRCEEITIPMCRGIGYNLTSFPNEMNHETQEEAGLEVHQFGH